MITVYRLLNGAIYVLASPFLRAKARRGDSLWRGRLLWDRPEGPVDLWIHAASAGEVRMAAVLIQHLRREAPDTAIHVTVMTEAGYNAARDVIAEDASVSYYPIDVRKHVTVLYEQLRPKVLVIAETEIWPNLITGASDRGIPVVLVNGRMSPKAYGRYKTIRSMFAGLLARYDRFFLKSDEDLQRYAYFGVSADKASVTGDMKFDAPLAPRSEGRRRELRTRAAIGENDTLLIAGSTRPGEEALLLDMYKRLRDKNPRLRLILAPRHLDRLEEVSHLITSSGAVLRLYSSDGPAAGDEVVLLDRMGVLTDLYTAADIAFVGGTLVDLGGHNLLEPVWAGTPVVFGPSVDNVAEAAAYIESHRFGRRVGSAEELSTVLADFLSGQLRFAQKTESDLEGSATVTAVRYIAALLKGLKVHA